MLPTIDAYLDELNYIDEFKKIASEYHSIGVKAREYLTAFLTPQKMIEVFELINYKASLEILYEFVPPDPSKEKSSNIVQESDEKLQGLDKQIKSLFDEVTRRGNEYYFSDRCESEVDEELRERITEKLIGCFVLGIGLNPEKYKPEVIGEISVPSITRYILPLTETVPRNKIPQTININGTSISIYQN